MYKPLLIGALLVASLISCADRVTEPTQPAQGRATQLPVATPTSRAAVTPPSPTSSPVAANLKMAPTPTSSSAPTPTPSPVPTAPPFPPRTPTPEARPAPTATPKSTPTATPGPGRVDTIFGPTYCDPKGSDRLTHPIYPPEGFDELVPLGRMFASHVTPTDHLYFQSYEPRPRASITAPASGYLVSIERFPRDQTSHWDASTAPDHRVVIAHSCSLFSIYIHVGELSPDVASGVGPLQLGERWNSSVGSPIFLEGGAVVATMAVGSFDYSLHDTRVVLPGLLIPEHYRGEPWKVHTVDPFDYMPEGLASPLAGKSARTAAPLGGKIDYDVRGTLAGNWFLDGTVDYSGNVAPGTYEYWNGHLAIAYDHIEPGQIRISIGADAGLDDSLCRMCMGVYGVRGNGPNPATVTASSGVVRYELVAREHSRADSREATRNLDDVVMGTLLASVVDDLTIRVEVVPGATSTGQFSGSAVIYRR